MQTMFIICMHHMVAECLSFQIIDIFKRLQINDNAGGAPCYHSKMTTHTATKMDTSVTGRSAASLSSRSTHPKSTLPPTTPHGRGISVIEFHMMDKRRFYPLSILSGVTIRSLLHPFNVIRTRLQVSWQLALSPSCRGLAV